MNIKVSIVEKPNDKILFLKELSDDINNDDLSKTIQKMTKQYYFFENIKKYLELTSTNIPNNLYKKNIEKLYNQKKHSNEYEKIFFDLILTKNLVELKKDIILKIKVDTIEKIYILNTINMNIYTYESCLDKINIDIFKGKKLNKSMKFYNISYSSKSYSSKSLRILMKTIKLIKKKESSYYLSHIEYAKYVELIKITSNNEEDASGKIIYLILKEISTYIYEYLDIKENHSHVYIIEKKGFNKNILTQKKFSNPKLLKIKEKKREGLPAHKKR